MPNQPILTTELRASTLNKTTSSAPPMYETPNQPTPTAQLEVLVPNKSISLVIPANKAPNQPLPAVQLGIPALLEQDLAGVPVSLRK